MRIAKEIVLRRRPVVVGVAECVDFVNVVGHEAEILAGIGDPGPGIRTRRPGLLGPGG
jgi:hypothetical protein